MLIENGKVGKYFWYALGEILLVVIGILIALQVNNWNETRKARADELVMLENLLEDFTTRHDELDKFQKIRIDVLTSIEELTKYIADPSGRPDDAAMDQLLVPQLNLLLFNDQFKVLDVLFSTGEINEISNSQLKKLLLNWPQLVEEMMEEQRMRYDLYVSNFFPILNQHLSMRTLLENWTVRNYPYSQDWSKRKQSDYNSLLLDERFENYLGFIELLHRINGFDTKNLLTSSEEIIELLKAEINSVR